MIDFQEDYRFDSPVPKEVGEVTKCLKEEKGETTAKTWTGRRASYHSFKEAKVYSRGQ